MNRLLPLIIIIQICLTISVSSCRGKENQQHTIEKIESLTYTEKPLIESGLVSDSIDNDSVNDRTPVKIIKNLQDSKSDTIINGYRITYGLSYSKDSTDLIGPFEIKTYRPVYSNISDYDTLLYYKSTVVDITISRLGDNTINLTDSIVITRKCLADFLEQDINSDVSHFCVPSVALEDVKNDSLFFSFVFAKFDSDDGWCMVYLHTNLGDSLYTEPLIWDDF